MINAYKSQNYDNNKNITSLSITLSESSQSLESSVSVLPFSIMKEINEILNGNNNGNSLDLRNKNINDDMVKEISQWIDKFDNNIKIISLSLNKITSKGASILFTSLKKNSYINKIILDGNKLIDDNCIQSLGELLQNNNTIEQIDIGSNKISDKGIEELLPFSSNNSILNSLNFSKCKGITNKSIPLLIELIEKSKIKNINILGSGITEKNVLVIPLAKSILSDDIVNKFIFSQKDITDDILFQICELIKTLKFNNKIEYDFGNNKLSSKGASSLFNSLIKYCKSVKKLLLDGNNINDGCLDLLGNLLQGNQYLEHIDISNNKITDAGIKILNPFLIGNTVLKTFTISRNVDVTNLSIPFLIEIIEKSNIKSLSIRETSITFENALIVPLLANKLKGGLAEKILFYQSQVNDEDLIKMCQIMNKYGCNIVTEIDLGSNNITSKGALPLLDVLESQNCNAITSINFYHNSIGDECIKLLGEIIQNNQNIQSIGIGYNKVTDIGIEVLQSYLIGNTSLESLDISYNVGITDKSVSLLIEAVLKSCLNHILLYGTSISFEMDQKISSHLKVPLEDREIPIESSTKSAAKF